MPVIDGKVVRSRFTSLKLNELSSVDRPAQPGALATIMKRHVPITNAAPSILAVAVAKYVSDDDGAHTFDEVLQANVFEEKIWPMTSALSQSIRSIMGDTTIKAPDRETKVTQSVDEFLAAVRDLSPTAEKRLAELISKRNDPMPKTMEELQALVGKLTSDLEAANGELTTTKAALTAAEQAKMKAEEDKKKADKALGEATDEILKVDGTDVRKSEVGAASFAVFKSLDDRATVAILEKRAGDEFAHVPGTATEKALVLKHAAAMPEEVKKTFEAILTSAEKMAAGGFSRLGGGGGNIDADVQKAVSTFKGKVTEIAKRDNIAEFEAMRKARTEFPAEFEAAYPQGEDA